jgi:hypothetical protein
MFDDSQKYDWTEGFEKFGGQSRTHYGANDLIFVQYDVCEWKYCWVQDLAAS